MGAAKKADAYIPLQPEAASLPNPLATGPYGVNRSYYYAGNLQLTVTATGATGSTCTTTAGGSQPNPLYGQSTHCAGNTFPQPLEGSVTWPQGFDGPYKPILLLHGRHTACKSTTGTDSASQSFLTGECPNKTAVVGGPSGPETAQDIGSETGFWPSWGGYNYLSDLLASWGYVVISPSAGALVTYDGTPPIDAGAMSRAEIVANTLDLLYSWNTSPAPAATATQTAGGGVSVGSSLIGKIDFSKVAIMGHSRGGEGVTQFIEYNRQRPEGGRRYNLTGVFSLAPIDRNKHYPHGTNFATLLPACDGDVSTLSGANAFERGRYADLDDQFSKYQFYVEGANHNFYNTRWPSSDRTGTDAACGTTAPATNTNIRLTNADQRLTGLATMATFLRIYGGGETQLKPWLTDEVGYPPAACPVGPASATVHLLAYCEDVIKASYIAPAGERQDVIRPDSGVIPTTANPTAPDSAGGRFTGTGFAVFDWCNPDPFSLSSAANPPATQTTTPLDLCAGPGTPTTSFNRSFGPQLSLAWDGPATLAATLRGEARDATRFKSLSLRASVQVSDTARNPDVLLAAAGYDPRAANKDFEIALVDRDGTSQSIKLTDVYPGGLESTLGSTTANGQPRHEVLNGFRIPLDEFDDPALDLEQLDRVEIRFGGPGVDSTGAIQFSTLAFQELADAPVEPLTLSVPRSPLPGDEDLPDVDALVTGNSTLATRSGHCVDTTEPKVTIDTAVAPGGALKIKGSSVDYGCAATKTLDATPGSVERVQVTVVKRTQSGKCQFVISTGKTLEPTRCSIPMSIIAAGTKSWRVAPPRKLASGTYKVVAVAIDGGGNVSERTTTRIKVG